MDGTPAGASAKDREVEMTKLRFLLVAVIAMAMLVVPGAAMARHHSGHKTKHAKRHHKRHAAVRQGSTSNSQSPTTSQSSMDGSVEVRNSSVVSFDSATGKLTITLPGNQTLSGNVTSATEIECEPAGQEAQDENGQGDQRRMFRDGGGDNSGDNQGDEQDNNDQNDNDADDQPAQSPQCSTADLTPGAQVSEAELNGNGDFTKVELVK
jgi:hypothetical protein